MGFYVRKSIRLGPLRFNLSSSGIGVSTGIRGLRVGTGPRGHYIHMGAGGLYYRKTIAPARTKTPHVSMPQAPSVPSWTHGPMEEIGTKSVDRMIDTNSAALLAELEEKRRRIRVFPTTTIVALILIVLLLKFHVSLWLTLPLLILLIGTCVFTFYFDLLKKSVVIMYDLDDDMHASFKRLHESMALLSRLGATWHISGQAKVHDSKYHAGAGQLIQRKKIAIDESLPPFVRTNISVIKLPTKGNTLYFLPDTILVFSGNQVGSIGYADLKLEFNSSRFIEEGNLPYDANVVDQTWRFVNKNGGPDRRFNNNSQIPICEYEELRLITDHGLNELLQLSKTGHSQHLRCAVQELSRCITSLRNRVHIEEVKNTQPVQQADWPTNEPIEQQSSFTPKEVVYEPLSSNDLFKSFFELMCCIMVSDGCASVSEKQLLAEAMVQIGANWSSEVLRSHYEDYLVSLKSKGFDKMFDNSLRCVRDFNQYGRLDIMWSCLTKMANADGKLTEKEESLLMRVHGMCG